MLEVQPSHWQPCVFCRKSLIRFAYFHDEDAVVDEVLRRLGQNFSDQRETFGAAGER